MRCGTSRCAARRLRALLACRHGRTVRRSQAAATTRSPQRVLLTAGRSTVLIDRVRHHAHRGDQSGRRRRRGGQAARDAGRRQGRRHRQPDRLGRRPSASTTTSSSIPGVTNLQQNFQQLFPGEDINVVGHRRSRHPLRRGLEQRRDAARRASCRRRPCRSMPVINMLAAAQRLAEQAGDAAGALRRSEPQCAAAVGTGAVRRRATTSPGRTTTQQFPAPDFDEATSTSAVHRLPERLPVLSAPRASAACSRRCRAAASCRAWPSPT